LQFREIEDIINVIFARRENGKTFDFLQHQKQEKK